MPSTRLSSGSAPVSARPGFRPDVQALRAIAVAAVVTYHLWPRALRGGFVGVDVFYAISGYLITGLLVREVATSGRVALTRFWARRIRRLLPAACLVLAVCLVATLALLPRLTWPENVLEIRASALYTENWLLARHAVDYLAAGNSPSLVQHYWSLSVEEQFYLCWPLLLVVALRLPLGSVRRRVGAALLVVFAASFADSVWATAADPRTAFFATTTRGWEFAVGGWAALVPNRAALGRGASVAAWGGLAAVLASTVAIGGRDPFPGAVAAVPVGGAALFLWAGAGRQLRWARQLRWTGWRPVQWVGDNSYSIYLWHWPLIVAAPWLLHGRVSGWARLGIAVASLLLAAATRRFVEDPIRYGRRWRARRRPAYVGAAVAIGVLVAATALPVVRSVPDARTAEARAAARARGFEAPAPARSTASPAAGSTASGSTASGSTASGSTASTSSAPAVPVSCYGAGAMVFLARCPHAFDRPPGLDTAFAEQDGRTYDCLAPAGTTTVHLCRFGRTRAPSRVIAIVGNSHARRLVPALDAYGRQHGWEILAATEINCMGVITRAVVPGDSTYGCLTWSQHLVRDLLALPRLDAVVFASFGGAVHFLTSSWAPARAYMPAVDRAILATWREFARRGIRVIVPQDVPGVRPHLDPECIAQTATTHDPCSISRARGIDDNMMDRLARAHPELATYLPLDQYFCDSRRCHGLIGGLVVYSDSNHLTATFARSLGPYLGPRVAALLP